MLRLSLEELILQILALDLGDPYVFLESAISPPESMSIRNALKFLGVWCVVCGDFGSNSVFIAVFDVMDCSAGCGDLEVLLDVYLLRDCLL
jgi:hypothetical protein